MILLILLLLIVFVRFKRWIRCSIWLRALIASILLIVMMSYVYLFWSIVVLSSFCSNQFVKNFMIRVSYLTLNLRLLEWVILGRNLAMIERKKWLLGSLGERLRNYSEEFFFHIKVREKWSFLYSVIKLFIHYYRDLFDVFWKVTLELLSRSKMTWNNFRIMTFSKINNYNTN